MAAQVEGETNSEAMGRGWSLWMSLVMMQLKERQQEGKVWNWLKLCCSAFEPEQRKMSGLDLSHK